ncbi:MAG TPA: redoxin domain-containing protein [Planctomycetes bacterium]|nr:redoxin domain-containing protein [Planctomycetota bacterium]
MTQVLAPCGKPAGKKAAAPAAAPARPAPQAASLGPGRLLLPGEKALDFQLPAVVGDQIKMVKLSDYKGKWRVLCFYPADFTFV